MFEMKYDKNGEPILPASKPQPVAQAAPAIHEQPELEMVENQTEAEPSMVENQTEAQVAAPQAQPQQAPDPKKSWSDLRAQKEKAERERDFLLQRLQEVEQQKASKANAEQQPETPQDLDLALGPDEIAEGKHLSKVQKKIKELENQVKQFHQQTATISVEAKLKAQYPDFDSVVTRDNIEMLRATYPELANTLNASNDLYAKAVSAYTLIRKLGIQPDPEPFKADVQKALANAAKPRPVASISPQQGESPLTRANAFSEGLTEELKAQLVKEMYAARRSH